MNVNIAKLDEIINELKDTKLVVATKYFDVDDLYILEKHGVKYFGENQVKSLLKKYEEYKGNSIFYMIGNLQTNKVKSIIDKVDMIQSVDSIKLIKEIDKQAKKINKVMDILLEINISKEITKHGFYVEEICEILDHISEYKNVRCLGFMMMAPNDQNIEIFFKKMKTLFIDLKNKYKNLPIKELSMGMSNDYKIALKYNPTMVRLGHILIK